MSKNVIIAGVAAVVVVAGVATYVVTRPDGQSSATTESESSSQVASSEKTTSTSASIRSFLDAGENKKCTFSHESQSGTVYFDGDNRARIDFRSTEAEARNGGVIIMQGKQYFWDNDKKEGFVTEFTSQDAQSANDAPTSSEDNVSVDETYDFTCEAWERDEAIFTPPSDIKFTDVTALTQQFQ